MFAILQKQNRDHMKITIKKDETYCGELVGQHIEIQGHFRGSIHAKNIYLGKSSYVNGSIVYGCLTVENGARVDARCQRRA
ncbi:MAG: polymer-forming cytoskeletal protein [Methylocystaceae bacterium]|nr:polymer-forming cytoskeletal protein [Methylocystaceae bacterium]